MIHFFDASVVFLLDYMLPRYIKRVDSFSDINIFNRKSNVHCVPKKLWSRTLAITFSNLNRCKKFCTAVKRKKSSTNRV